MIHNNWINEKLKEVNKSRLNWKYLTQSLKLFEERMILEQKLYRARDLNATLEQFWF